MGYNWSFSDNLAKKILLNYLDLRNRFFLIDIEKPYEQKDDGTLGVVNNDCNHLFFQTNTETKQELLKVVKKKFIDVFRLDKNAFKIEFYNSKSQISVLLNKGMELDLNNITLHRTRIF